IPATSQRNSGIEVAPSRPQHCHLTKRVPTCQSWGKAMTSITQESGYGMHRAIGWRDAVFIAAGGPALVLFSMGAISATIGAPAWLGWAISVLFGFIPSFIYAEIAGLPPSKSGGAGAPCPTAM